MLKLTEKRQVLQQLDELQREPKILCFMINRIALIMVSIISGNWNTNVLHIISLLISNKICTSVIFELRWKSTAFINENCKSWVKHAVEIVTNMFQIFKWELLDGVELAV